MSSTPLASALAAVRDARCVLEGVDPLTSPVPDLGAEIAQLQVEIDALTGIAAGLTTHFADQDGPADAGAGSLAAWLRRELGVTGRDARRRVRVGRLLEALPATAKSLRTGTITAEHAAVLGAAVEELGLPVIAEAEPILLDLAEAADPDALRTAVRRLRDTLDPDAADEAYVRALERRDVTVTAVGEMYALRGLLDPVAGEALKAVLYALSKLTGANDDRTAGQRRHDALRQVCEERLRNGVPTDHGHRPHLLITVPVDRLTPSDNGCGRFQPAALAGFGSVGDTLLQQLMCDGVWTPVLVDGYDHVLDVGRTRRLATGKQRVAIVIRQNGVCAGPGCRATHLEIHHLIAWADGGATDLANLAGYCSRCHHLIHAGRLVLRPDGAGGWVHEDSRGRRLRDQWREADQANRAHVEKLARQAFDEPADFGVHADTDVHAEEVDGTRLHDELKRQRRRRSKRRNRERYRWRPPPDDP